MMLVMLLMVLVLLLVLLMMMVMTISQIFLGFPLGASAGTKVP